ncbi:MAG: hypothetical protein M1393_04680 [Candidatus Thermoplasmatota archaeon]|nr:hypothetical protein [Candidatus Thermoplasmatota archaeon]MDA8143758.1 hypothetical protein [Thermoplasmatales archaeon]
MARINVSMKNELLKSINEESEKSGKTVSSLLSEAAVIYLETKKVWVRADEILSSLKLLGIMKEINSVPIPGILLDNLIKIAFNNSEEEVIKRWYERGQVIGDILKKYSHNLKDVVNLITEYSPLLPMDIFEVEMQGDVTSMVISGAGYSIEAAKCTAEGLRGFLKSYGYSTEKIEFSEGFVKIVAKPTVISK